MQAELFVELGKEADRLEIPWASPDDPQNRFYDLKNHPEVLEQIVEARALPPLRGFLREVNAPSTLFATAKCDTWETTEFSATERLSFPAARTKFAAYIDLFFARSEFNFQRQHYEQLARRLISQLNSREIQARAELCLRHCYYTEQDGWGFYLTVFLYGYGRQAAEAQQQWTAGLSALQQTLLGISRVLAALLRRQEAEQGMDPPLS